MKQFKIYLKFNAQKNMQEKANNNYYWEKDHFSIQDNEITTDTLKNMIVRKLKRLLMKVRSCEKLKK